VVKRPSGAPAEKALYGDTSEIDGLRALLEAQNLAAVDRFRALFKSLSLTLHATRFERLSEAIDNLDFPRAAELLRDARFNGMNTKEAEAARPVRQ
jgi:hypothetical protein